MPIETKSSWSAAAGIEPIEAGAERILLDAEWEELQRDFPDDPSVQAARSEYDGDAIAAEPAVTRGSLAERIPWWVWWSAVMALFQLARSCQCAGAADVSAAAG
jgi:hypothetical protein